MNQGWIKLYRRLQDSEIWNMERFTRGQAWVDMLLMANHKDHSFILRGIEIKVKKGQIAMSEETFGKKWSWSRGKVRRFFSWLKMRQQIVQQKSKLLSIVTIINYAEYQENDTTNGTTDGQQTVQQTDTYNNVKNVKNEKKNIIKAKKSKVSEEEKPQIKKITDQYVVKLKQEEEFADLKIDFELSKYLHKQAEKDPPDRHKDQERGFRNWLKQAVIFREERQGTTRVQEKAKQDRERNIAQEKARFRREIELREGNREKLAPGKAMDQVRGLLKIFDEEPDTPKAKKSIEDSKTGSISNDNP